MTGPSAAAPEQSLALSRQRLISVNFWYNKCRNTHANVSLGGIQKLPNVFRDLYFFLKLQIGRPK